MAWIYIFFFFYIYLFLFQITAEDLLPTTVCGECVNKLEICHNLIQGCLDADAMLKTMFGLNSNQVSQILVTSKMFYVRIGSIKIY